MNEDNKKRGRGRPKKVDSGCRNHINVRLSDEEMGRLEGLANQNGETLTDTVRSALKVYEKWTYIRGKLDEYDAGGNRG